jgi:hypothetical protein
MIKVELDNLNPNHQDFYEVRDRLVAAGKKFDRDSLRLLTYSQLNLCCIGNAATAACPTRLVQEEKVSRRERFLNMEQDEFQSSSNYLKIEQMFDDVNRAIATRNAPAWDDFNDRQKAWLKLTCIMNHVDDVPVRIKHAILLLKKASESTMPPEVCVSFMIKLRAVMTVFPGKISDGVFRDKIGDIAEDLLDFFPEEERIQCLREEVRDFQCTSDCFQVVV